MKKGKGKGGGRGEAGGGNVVEIGGEPAHTTGQPGRGGSEVTQTARALPRVRNALTASRPHAPKPVDPGKHRKAGTAAKRAGNTAPAPRSP